MVLRHSFVLLSACLVLSACDGDGDDSTTSNSTSGGDGTSDPTDVSVSVTVTTPTSDPSTTNVTATPTGGSTTDDSTAEGSTVGDSTAEGSTTAGEDSSSSDESSSTTAGAGATIYAVQDGTIAEGETVTIESVVITGVRVGVGVVVQEIEGGEYSAVYVDTGELDLDTFTVGDIVDLTGETAESNPSSNGLEGLTQILLGKRGSMTPTGDAITPEAETVEFAVLADPATAEPWECVLVTTSGSFTAVASGDSFGQFGEFAAQSGADVLLVDNFLYAIFDAENAADFPGFGEGSTFTELSGVLNYSFGDFKIAPRSAAELGGFTP